MSKTKDTIDRAYRALCRLAGSAHEGERLLGRILEIAATQERQYRAMGKRFTHGQAAYRESVQTAARYFACKWVAEGPPGGADTTFSDAARLRDDAFLGYALRGRIDEQMLDEGFVQRCKISWEELNEIKKIDYSEHIAS